MSNGVNGTAKDVGGVAVDRVLVSQATRDMAAGRSKSRDFEEELRAGEADYEAKLARKRQIEARLGQLNGRVIGAGRLPGLQYRSIVEEQNALKRELGDVMAETSTMKLNLDKLRHQIREKKAEHRDRVGTYSEPMAPILRDILSELKAIRAKLDAAPQ